MTAHELLSQLRAKGVEVKTSGDDRLVIDVPKGTITEELRSSLAAHKGELLQILKAEQAQAESPAVPEELIPVAPVTPPVAAARVIPQPEDQMAADSTAEEIKQLEVELMRLRTEEEARRAEIEAERLAAENALRVEQERWQTAESELARQRADRERQRIEAEA